MDYFSKHFSQLTARFRHTERRNSVSTVVRRKIRIVRQNPNSAKFYFPNDNTRPQSFDSVISPVQCSQIIKDRLDLISDTIVYAQKKIRKLSSGQGAVCNLVTEEEADRICKEWYDNYSNSVIKCLAPGVEVSSNLVERYIKLIPAQHSIHCALPCVYQSISSDLDQVLSKSNYTAALQRSGLRSLLDKSYIILPVKTSVWSLICINNEAEVLEFFSSDLSEDFKNPCEKVERLLGAFEDVRGYDWECYEMPQSNSRHDSGVFMLLAIKALILNNQFSFDASQVEYHRTVISAEIQRNSLL